MHMHNCIAGPSNSSPSFKGDCLWHLNILEKLKLFLWQSYCDILPTKDNLLCWWVNIDFEGPMCNLEDESVLHCLKSCQGARAVWMGCPLSLLVSEIQADTFTNFFNNISTLLQKEQLELFCMLCWKIWHARNELLWNANIWYGSSSSLLLWKGAGSIVVQEVIMEYDCASTVTAINTDILTMHSSLGSVLSYCRILMASFLSCTVQHVHREGNSVAHELAICALHAEANEYWIEEVPTDIT
ncbi:hypothetical protein SLEP1_g55825 [Rubroshorea leprosula]|uniref:RNase H type-1 domain-containing protein n=1 Tax=Rubroshorea leprosula TaxID=152421 RepID=A0AAV5MJM2_9ROSI|nr:hypothetical protein SLEP1_g55825 [Rubroshorea leprosula]